MRIIAGKLKGRIFSDPPGAKAHPMSERIKNALFNVLGDLSGLTLLDAFGGSGALAFEAISRGAKSAVICESDRRIAANIKTNITQLKLDRSVTLIEKNVYSYLNTGPASFDIIILDPPYQQYPRQKFEKFIGFVKPGGTLVLSFPSLADTPVMPGLDLIKRHDYGNAALAYYRQA